LKKTLVDGCIYRITLVRDGRTYVGQTRKKEGRRWSEHKKLLRSGSHYNDYLQKAWNAYGESSFEFAVLEPVKYLEDLTAAEMRWIRMYDATNRQRGFNLSGNAQYCVVASDATRQKLSAIASRPENIERRRQATQTSKFRQMMGQISRKFWESSDRRARASEIFKEKWQDPDYVYKVNQARSAATLDNSEYREKLSQGVRRALAMPGNKERRSAAIKKSWQDPEIRASRMLGHKIAMADPSVKSKISEGVRRSHTPEMLKRRGKTIQEVKSEVYELTSPSGKVYVTNRIQAFCDEHGLKYKPIANAATHPERKLRCGWSVKNISKTNA
jgi:group I intron endonuclease